MKAKTSMQEKPNSKLWPLMIAAGVLLAGYTIACVYLYYNQSINMGNTEFESDLPYHIKMAVEDHWGYSLTAVIYRLFSHFPMTNLWIAVFLALCTSGTLIVTYFGLNSCLQKPYVSAFFTLCSGFVMPIVVRAVHYQRYIGYQSPSIWHNSTYIAMKLLAIAVLVYYWYKVKPSGEQLTVKSFIILSLLITLTTATKTSFVLVFAPAWILFLLLDFIRGVPFKKCFALGMTMFPSLLVILLQKAILFNTEDGVNIDFLYTLTMHTGNVVQTMILSALFPVLIFLANIVPFAVTLKKDLSKDLVLRKSKSKEQVPELQHRAFWFAWLIWLFGFLEIVFLCETGKRALDANFAWGYYLALFVVFIVSMVVWWKNITNKNFAWGIAWLRIVYAGITGGVLLYHTYCGFVFFKRLMEGTTYFM